jgi:hypothetical protein
MSRSTVFTWGYWGWGNATAQFVRLADAAEAARGFAAPMFVDVRISRSVRAKGFNGNAFGQLVGVGRYRHLPGLGNLAVLGVSGPTIQIKDPARALDLLHIALGLAGADRRVLFFCSCEFPRLEENENCCHRVTVARLVLEAATERQLPLEVVEWPGGEPQVLDLRLPPAEAGKLLRGGKSVPLGQELPSASFGSLPWGSIARVHSAIGEFGVAVGPARYGRGGWYLPVPWETADKDASIPGLQAKASQWRREFGYEARATPVS